MVEFAKVGTEDFQINVKAHEAVSPLQAFGFALVRWERAVLQALRCRPLPVLLRSLLVAYSCHRRWRCAPRIRLLGPSDAQVV
eukprot:SAG22_NODE_11483_length_480_cov_1.305483_1_plen_83_part_00